LKLVRLSSINFKLLPHILQNVVALAMLVRQFNFQMAVGAPPVSSMLFIFYMFSGQA